MTGGWTGTVSGIHQVYEMIHQKRDVCLAVIQGRHIDDDHAEAVIKVFSECSLLDLSLELLDVLNSRTEDVLVLSACLLSDLHVCAVQSTQSHSAVEHQLHVAGAGSLGACRRDLLRHIGSRNDMLGIRTVIVLHKHDLQLIADFRVVVDKIGNAVDITDDCLI